MAATKLAIASFFALVACSSAAEEPAHDPPTEQTVLQATAACDLRHSGVAFTAKACETCMQQKCCAQTTACFSGNQDCAELHACLIACPADHPVTIPAGLGAPDVSKKERREIENPCAASCEAAHAASVARRSAYDSCIRTECMPACAM